jgi:hypothetical protein
MLIAMACALRAEVERGGVNLFFAGVEGVRVAAMYDVGPALSTFVLINR